MSSVELEMEIDGGDVPSAWLLIVYPPIVTLSQYTGPLAEPARYGILKSTSVARAWD